MKVYSLIIMITVCSSIVYSSSEPEKKIDIFWQLYYQEIYNEFQESYYAQTEESSSSQEVSPISSPSPQKSLIKNANDLT